MRHGHTAWNRAGRIQGRVDEPLDDEARRQLSRLRFPSEFDGAELTSSPLSRAIETAKLVGGHQPTVVPELVEMDWGDWEGLRGLDLLEDEKSGYRHIEEWSWDFRPPGGETPRQVWDRISPWVGSLAGSTVAVCHIGIMRVLLAKATGWEFLGQPPFKIKRDRLYRIEVDESGALTYDDQPIRLIEAG